MTMLYDEPPLTLSPHLAKALGDVNAAIFLQQLHYWIEKGMGEEDEKGRRWIYNSVRAWNEQMPWLCANTMRNIISRLKRDGLILTKPTKRVMDNTLCYTIAYDKLYEMSHDVCEKADMTCHRVANNIPKFGTSRTKAEFPTNITKTTTEITTKTTTRARRVKEREPDPFSACEDEELRQTLKDFEEMRRVSCKKPMTNRAKILLLNKLKKLAGDDYDMMLALLNQSIEHGWQTVYPLKQEAPQRKSTSSHALDVGQQAIEMLKAMEQEDDSGG